MKETSKAMLRRWSDMSFPWAKIFRDDILDVGSGDDPLPGATPFDLPDGGGDDLTKFFPRNSFATIHGSQVLEHAADPRVMLQSWLDVVRPGGHIVVSIPDWELYEKQVWPSRFNHGHRSTWSTAIHKTPALIHCLLPQWLYQFPADVLLCRLIDTSDPALPPTIDQTYPEDGAEVFIEFVLRKL
jgi:SAM-dependent methyltransferase